MRATIGQALIVNLKPADRQYEIRDSKLTGFLIRVNPGGKINYVCEYARGKRLNIGSVGVLTPAQARDKAKEILADYTRGIEPGTAIKTQGSVSFQQFVQSEYIPWFNANHKSPKSLENLKPFIKAFGDTPFNEIQAFTIEKWRIARLEHQKVSLATVNRNLAALKAVFSKAHEWGFIEGNPLRPLKLARVDPHAKIRYLTEDEEQRLRNSLEQRETRLCQARENANHWRSKRGYPEKPHLDQLAFADYMQPLVLISLNTGLRKSELLSLSWEHVDLPRAMITVAGAFAKSGKTRHIPLNNEALTTFNLWHQQCEIKTGLVFPNKYGNRFNDIKKSWATILRDAAIENFRWHDMRHHFASRLIMAGVDLNTVRELLGHADIKMTLRYAHLAPEHKAQAVARLDRIRSNV